MDDIRREELAESERLPGDGKIPVNPLLGVDLRRVHNRGEAAMIIRLYRAKARPGKLDELKEMVQREAIPYMKKQKGLLGFYPGADPDTDRIVMISLWEDIDCLKAVRPEHWDRPFMSVDEIPILEESHVNHFEAFGLP